MGACSSQSLKLTLGQIVDLADLAEIDYEKYLRLVLNMYSNIKSYDKKSRKVLRKMYVDVDCLDDDAVKAAPKKYLDGVTAT